MASSFPWIVLLAVFGVVFQIWLKDTIWLGYGIGKNIEPLENFPYSCHTIDHEPLHACEDMWLSESTRQLFLACSNIMGRHYWHPSMGQLNNTGRSKTDSLVALSIDSPSGQSFKLRKLKTPNFDGIDGDGSITLNGFDAREDGKGGVDFYLVNNRPSVDPATGRPLEKQIHGHNGTVEHFHLKDARKGTNLKHIKTYANPFIVSPNRPAIVGDTGFYVTNDHGLNNIGIWHDLSLITGTGTVTYCDRENDCKTAATDLNYPNGLIREPRSGLIFVPSSTIGWIRIYEPQVDKSLKLIQTIFLEMGIDNLSVDANGDIWAACFPQSLGIGKANASPGTHFPPVTIYRIWKDEIAGWKFEKVLEDTHSKVLPAATTAVHDVKTGRIFVSGVISPFIAVCEKKPLA